MTATYGEVGLSYDAINWSYNGTELHTGAIDPTVFLDARGALVASVASSTLAAPAAIGLSSLAHASGQLRAYTAQGTLRS